MNISSNTCRDKMLRIGDKVAIKHRWNFAKGASTISLAGVFRKASGFPYPSYFRLSWEGPPEKGSGGRENLFRRESRRPFPNLAKFLGGLPRTFSGGPSRDTIGDPLGDSREAPPETPREGLGRGLPRGLGKGLPKRASNKVSGGASR